MTGSLPTDWLAGIGQILVARRSAVVITPAQVKERLLHEFSPKLHCLFEACRYKVLYSGRAATKSWSASQWILQQGYERPIRVMCARETMKSIADSVHKLLCDQILRLGLQHHYETTLSTIRGRNGTEIFYAGLRNNVANIKSVEGCDIVWVEEAQNVSGNSWDTLIPTVRKEGSEILVTFNPDLETDPTYQRFVLHPPPGANVVRLNWRDNPYLNEMMRSEIDYLKATDPDAFEHIYEGATRSTVQDAVYKAEILRAEKEGRFANVQYDARRTVDTYWDLGYGDMVSVWFVQAFPFETRVIDYYENTHQSIDHYLQVCQSRGYVYGQFVFPWDGGARHVSTGKSTADIVRSKGFKVEVLRQGLVHDRINQLRMMFPQLVFDGIRCAEGIQHLRHYQWGPPAPNGTLKREPLHDEHSHASNALEYMAQHIKSPAAIKQQVRAMPLSRHHGSMGWAR